MIVTRLIGGLGNQMFQYAVGRALSLRHEVPLFLDMNSFSEYRLREYALGVYNIQARALATNEVPKLKLAPWYLPKEMLRRLAGRPRAHSRGYCGEREQFVLDHALFERRPPLYLDGYWQNEKYFIGHRETILRDFSLKAPISERARAYQRMIGEVVSVSLHVRRGDYVSNPAAHNYHGTLGLDYYDRAMGIIGAALPEPSIFVFSDEIAWAKEHLKYDRMVFVEGCEDFEEIFLMSCCRHNVTANSSFSWWGAWLNNNPDRVVVAPRRWVNPKFTTGGPHPESWMRI